MCMCVRARYVCVGGYACVCMRACVRVRAGVGGCNSFSALGRTIWVRVGGCALCLPGTGRRGPHSSSKQKC